MVQRQLHKRVIADRFRRFRGFERRIVIVSLGQPLANGLRGVSPARDDRARSDRTIDPCNLAVPSS